MKSRSTVFYSPINQIQEIDAKATQILKKWLGLHITANPAILYLPKSDHGLGLPSIIDKLKAMQLVKAHIVTHSKDHITSAIAAAVATKQAESYTKQWKPFPTLASFDAALTFDPNLRPTWANMDWVLTAKR